MFATVRRFVRNESGATAIEYGLIAALISVAAIIAMTAMGSSLADLFSDVANTLSCAATGEPIEGGEACPD